MSLTNTTPSPAYHLGVLAAKDFDDPALLDELLGTKLDTIATLYTNGVNGLITEFARTNGITHVVYPVAGGRGLPASTRDIVDASDVVLLIATPDSKSAAQIAVMCEAKAQREPAFKWRRIDYEPISHWREKAEKVSEILAGMPEDDLAANPWASSIKAVVG